MPKHAIVNRSRNSKKQNVKEACGDGSNPSQSVHFVAGWRQGIYNAHAVARSYRTAPGYAFGTAPTNFAKDWVLIALAEPIGIRPVPLAPAGSDDLPESGRTEIRRAGYSHARAERMSAQNVGVGMEPTHVALGDMDGDGDLDVLTANSGANTVSIRLNDGTGSFGGGTDFGVGTYPYGMAVGDVDGDGDLDVLTANYGASGTGNTVSVRLNNGTGPPLRRRIRAQPVLLFTRTSDRALHLQLLRPLLRRPLSRQCRLAH